MNYVLDRGAAVDRPRSHVGGRGNVMSDDMQELARRLVVGTRATVAPCTTRRPRPNWWPACGRPGASVSRLARECGVNANQLSRWVREHSQRRQRAVAVSPGAREAFVAVPVKTAAAMPTVTDDSPSALRMNLQARLPNGVVLDLRELELRQAGVVIAALGRLRCSASTSLDGLPAPRADRLPPQHQRPGPAGGQGAGPGTPLRCCARTSSATAGATA